MHLHGKYLYAINLKAESRCRHLSRWDIQVALRCGCSSTDRKVVNAGKRLRAYVGLDEGEVTTMKSETIVVFMHPHYSEILDKYPKVLGMYVAISKGSLHKENEKLM